MIANNHGHLVNIASSAGLIGVNGLAGVCYFIMIEDMHAINVYTNYEYIYVFYLFNYKEMMVLERQAKLKLHLVAQRFLYHEVQKAETHSCALSHVCVGCSTHYL